MNTIQVANKTYTIKSELSEGCFYLEGPRGGTIFAKVNPCGTYTFHEATDHSGRPMYYRGVLQTATREDLA